MEVRRLGSVSLERSTLKLRSSSWTTSSRPWTRTPRDGSLKSKPAASSPLLNHTDVESENPFSCLDSDLLKGRTVLLATHHLVLVTPIASFILRLGRDGTVESQGPIEKVIKEDLKFERVLAAEKKEVSFPSNSPSCLSSPGLNPVFLAYPPGRSNYRERERN